MKTNKIFIFPLAMILLTGCSGGAKGGFHGGGAPYAYEGEDGGPTGEDVSSEGEENSEPTIPAGQLTCSALDDNKYYDFWQEINTKAKDEQDQDGPFASYYENFGDDFNTLNRIKLTVNNGKDVYVTLKDDNSTYHVDNFHNAYLFASEKKETYEVDISYLDNTNSRVSVTKTVQNDDVIDLENTFAISNSLEIMFVIDATGSMGDEMKYIQAEIIDVLGKVKENNPDATITLAMMVYRDDGDDYVTRYSDFTSNIASQQQFLKNQKASGGGDFEEAVDVALTEAMDKQWSDNSTKVLFHVADAPAHDQYVHKWSKAIYKAAEKGIKIITVGASGLDQKTEFFFRSQSLLTGGQYVFLTDDSGIGNSHEQPTIKEPLVVEYLNECLIRLISGYYSGVMADPIPYNQSQE